MSTSNPVLTLVTYTPKSGKESALQALVEQHWPTLDRLGLVTKEPARIWRAVNKRTGAVSFVEIFSWKDEEASEVAHQTPEVMAVWEPMGAVMESLGLARLEPLASRGA
jgi:hypothetical protein